MAKMESIRRKDVNKKIEVAIEAVLLDGDAASARALASAASEFLKGLAANAGCAPFDVAIDDAIRPDTAEFDVLESVRDYATIYNPASRSDFFCHTTFPMRLFVAYLMRLYPNAALESFRHHIAPGACLPELHGPDVRAAAATCLRQYLDDRFKQRTIPPAMVA